MNRSLSLSVITILVAATLSVACGFEHTTNVLMPDECLLRMLISTAVLVSKAYRTVGMWPEPSSFQYQSLVSK